MKGKNKKGFTLMEIIIVISILVVIAGLFSANMINTLKKNKDEESKSVISQIISAADAYVAANPEEVQRLYKGYGYVDIEIGELRDRGLLSENLHDAETGVKIPDEETVRVKLEIGDYLGFVYPLTPEEKDKTSWAMVAEDLTVDYEPAMDSATWCADPQNIYSGLYDSDYVDKSNYAEVTSKLYLMDNSEEGKIFDGDYFDEALLEVDSCNVNPKVSGTYNITYKYADPNGESEEAGKTYNRTVYVKTSANDVISFTAEINYGLKIALGARDVPIVIVETYKDGSTAELKSTESALAAIDYTIEGFTTDEKGTRVATVSTTKTNSDGSKPQPQKPEYTVTDLLSEIIIGVELCTPNNANVCYLKCEQTDNYVSYNGTIYRVYGIDGTTVKFIYDGTEIVSPYGQLGNCTSNTCCNGGRYVYNKLGQTGNIKVPKPTMDTVLDKFYSEKSVAGNKLQSQQTPFGSKKIALLSKKEYIEIANSCPDNYLTGEAFWLVDSAESDGGPGAYNKGINKAYAYDYAVNKDGEVYKDGAHKERTFSGDYGTGNVTTAELAVRPTIYLNNPTIMGGNGTKSSPYQIR